MRAENDDPLAAIAREEPFLRQLARRLAVEPGGADDLVQETWLRAFTLRPEVGSGLRGWATTVLRRLAGQQRRAAARRAAREVEAARPEHVEDPLLAVERRLDAQAALVTALRRLTPEQREALVLRHADELPLAEIAARQRTSVANVRARLTRGLAALRADLDLRAGGGRGAHALLLGPLLDPRSGPRMRRDGPAAAAPTVTPAAGVLLMGNLLKVSYAAAALVAVALTVRQLGGAASRPEPAPEAGALAGEQRRAEPPTEIEPPSLGAARAELAQAAQAAASPRVPPAAPRELRVRVSSTRPRTVKVTVLAGSAVSGARGEQRLELEVDAPGDARCALEPLLAPLSDGAPVRSLLVQGAAPGCRTAALRVPLDPGGAGRDIELELTLDEYATVVGSVATRTQPLRVVAFALLPDDRLGERVGTAQVGTDGGYVLRVDHEGDVALAVLATDHAPETLRCPVARGETTYVAPVELAPAAAIRGTVVACGRPLAGMRVEAARSGPVASLPVLQRTPAGGPGGGEWGIAWFEGAFVTAAASARSEPDGSFALLGLAPGPHAVSVAGPSGMQASWGGRGDSRTVVAPAEGVLLESGWAELRLELLLPPRLAGQGVLRLGEPGWTPQGTGLSAEQLREDPVLVVGLRPGVETEARVEFAGFEPEVLVVRATRAGEVLSRTIEVRRAPGAIDLSVVLTGARVPDGSEFLLLDVRQAPAGDPGAALFPEGRPRIGIARDGRVLFEGVSPAPRSLRLVPGGAAGARHGALADALFELAPDDGEVRTVEVKLEQGAPLRVRAMASSGAPTDARARVLDAAGRHVAALFVARGPGGGTSTSSFGLDANQDGDGWNEVVPNLPPGDYVLEVELEGQARRDVPLRLVAGEQNEATVRF